MNKDEFIRLAQAEVPDLPVSLALSVFQQESGSGKNTGPSGRGAIGPMQVTPVAAKDVGIAPADLTDPKKNTIAGLRYLNKQYVESGNDPFAAAARYFGGPRAMENLSVTDGRVSRGQYATEVVNRMRGGQMAEGATSERNSGAAYGPENTPRVSSSSRTGLSDQIMSAFAAATEAGNKASTSIQGAIDSSQINVDELVKNITSQGAIAGDLLIDAAKIQNARAANVARRAATAGLDRDAESDMFSELVTEYNAYANVAREADKQLFEKGQMGFLDDPLGFLTAHMVEIPQLTRTYNQAGQVANNAASQLADINRLVQTQTVTDNATFAERSMDAAYKAAQAAALKAEEEVAKLKIATTSQIASLSVNQSTLATNEFSRSLQISAAELQEQTKKYQQLILEQKIDEIQKEKVGKALFERDLAQFGHTVNSYKLLNKEAQTVLGNVLGTGKYGPDPARAFANLGVLNPKLTPGQGVVISSIGELVRQVREGDPQFKLLKKEDDQLNFLSDKINRQFELYANNAQDGMNGKNPYHAPAPSHMLKEAALLNTLSPKAQETLKVIGEQTQGTSVDDQKIIKSLIAAISPGYSREAVIRDIEMYYKFATAMNNSTYKFKEMSLPVQSNYNISLTLKPGFFSQSIKADLTNPTAIAQVITLFQAHQKREEGGSILFGNPLQPGVGLAGSMGSARQPL